MSDKIIKPDLEFVNAVINAGGESLKKCFQCATCSVVCNMTPEDKPFPRKEMVQAQWGQKWELMRNPDIWLCHQCSDCTAHCPRGAKPGEVLNAIRKLSIEKYSAPSFLAKMVGDPRFLIPLLVLPVLALLPVLLINHSLPLSGLPQGKDIVFSAFFPIHFVDPIFSAAFFFAAGILGYGVTRYWKDMSRGAKLNGTVSEAVIEVMKELIPHSNFTKCNVTGGRKTAHMLVFFSFIGLAITTAWAVFYLYGMGRPSPYPLTDPLKLLGNVSAVALIAGIVIVMSNRFNNLEKAGLGAYYDWLFIGVVAMVGITGFGAQLLRLAGSQSAYAVYFLHLAMIFFLFFYAPYSKMAHMVYRTTAMVFSKMAGRK